MRNKYLTDEYYSGPAPSSRKAKFRARHPSNRARGAHRDDLYQLGSGFKCAHCGQEISAAALLSGVNNRNHCPYCLWSRHMDLYAGGDRLAACKAPMRPVGLTMKHIHKKYGSAQGELMLIHLCTECERVSINRIAADDDSDIVSVVFHSSDGLDEPTRTLLNGAGVQVLDASAASSVYAQLLGRPGAWLTSALEDSWVE